MNALQFPLGSIEEHGISVDATVPGEQLRPEGAKEFPIGPVRVKGTLTPSGHEYIFFGTVAGSITAPCARCLEDAHRTFAADVTWTFIHGVPEHCGSPTADDEDDGDVLDEFDDATVVAFDGQTIDMLPTVWEEIVLAAPIKVLCRDDCAGLCPKCGADLNRETCACGAAMDDDEFSNKGLAGLKDLIPKLDPGPPEE